MENALTVRDEMQVDRNKVNDLADRIAEFLPQSKSLPKDTRLAIAQIALAHRLDPFLGDIWAIPERVKDDDGRWNTTGYRIMIGISAWRRAAQESGEYWGRHFEKCTDEERKWLGAGPNDLTIRCIIYRRKTGQKAAEFDGFGIFKQGEKSKMNPLQCVRLRAERDALKGAFPIGFGGGAIKVGVADDSGEEINGEIDHGPKWDVITTDQREASLARVEARRQELCGDDDTLDELTKSAERDAVTNDPTAPPEPQAPSAPKPEPKERKSYRMARPVFDNDMNPEKWHIKANAFCSVYPNWQKDGKPDLNHVLASAGHAGYETITAANIDEVFAAIVATHEAQAKP